MFIDASALVAILTEEPEGEMMAEVVDEADAPITSAMAIYEAPSPFVASAAVLSAKRNKLWTCF